MDDDDGTLLLARDGTGKTLKADPSTETDTPHQRACSLQHQYAFPARSIAVSDQANKLTRPARPRWP